MEGENNRPITLAELEILLEIFKTSHMHNPSFECKEVEELKGKKNFTLFYDKQ